MRIRLLSSTLIVGLVLGLTLTVSRGSSSTITLSTGDELDVLCSSRIVSTAVSNQRVHLVCQPVDSTPTIEKTVTSSPPRSGMWIDREQLQSRSTSSSAWSQLWSVANSSIGSASIRDQDSDHDVKTLAVALVGMKVGSSSLRAKAASSILSAIGTERGGRTLALGRNLVSYVIAADVIQLSSYDSEEDGRFRSWLSMVRTEPLEGGTLVSTSEKRANNWGSNALASRIAVDIYLGDTVDLARSAKVFRGWLGDRSSYTGFDFGDLSWQCNPGTPVGVNPLGCTKSGHSIDGVLPDDQRRTGGFTWPPPCGNYPHGALQGALVSAELLSRAGYDAWVWSNNALLRAESWLYSSVDGKKPCPASGDDVGYLILVNRAYGSSFPSSLTAPPGKNIGWLGWTHIGR